VGLQQFHALDRMRIARGNAQRRDQAVKAGAAGAGFEGGIVDAAGVHIDSPKNGCTADAYWTNLTRR